MNENIYNIAIVGSGPAALTSAIYVGRALLDPILFEGFMAGDLPPGGQLTTTTLIENFPGFPNGIEGPKLMENMRLQAINNGTTIITETVNRIDFKSYPFIIYSDTTNIKAKSIIIATGATPKKLNIPSEKNFWQKGISTCATCDGALPIFRNNPIAVVGGGDSALEEALYLTRYASKVYIIHRRDTLRASKIMQNKAMENKKIEFIWDTIVIDAFGNKNLEYLKIKNLKTNIESDLKVNGLFYAIGHKPNTDFLKDDILLDDEGYIITKPNSTQTNIDGVFAAGDVVDKKYRQAIVAAGLGCMAAIEAIRYLESL